MYEIKKCDNCNRMLKDGDKVTLILPDIEIAGKYRKNTEGFRLKLSLDAVELRTSKVYCKNCLDINNHIMEEE